MPNIKNVKLYNGDVEIDFYPDGHRYKLKNTNEWLTSVTAISGLLDKSRQLIPWAVNLAVAEARRLVEESPRETFTAQDLEIIFTEAAEAPNKRRDKAATVGTIVHAYAEEFGKQQIAGTHEYSDIPKFLANRPKEEKIIIEERKDQIVNGIMLFLDWIEDVLPKFLEVEKIVYSKQHNYVGLVDAIAEIDGRKYLIDYKTSKGIYDDMRFQMAGYVYAYNEEMEATGEPKLAGSILVHFDKEMGKFHEATFTDYNKDLRAFLGLRQTHERTKELYKEYKESKEYDNGNKNTI